MSGIFDKLFRRGKPQTSKDIIYVGPSGEASRSLVPASRQNLTASPKKSISQKIISAFRDLDLSPVNVEPLIERFNILPASAKPEPEELPIVAEPPKEDVFDTFFEPAGEDTGPLYEGVPGEFYGAGAAQGTQEESAPQEGQVARPVPGKRPEHADWVGGEPPLYWSTSWRIPDAYKIAHDLKNDVSVWDLNGIFEFVFQNTDYPGWKRDVKESSHRGEPAKLEVKEVAHWSTAYEDLANLFGVPQRVLDMYFGDVRSEKIALEMSYLFINEVIQPIAENFSKAMDALRPVSLRGWFAIEPAEDMGWWLTYKEAKFKQ